MKTQKVSALTFRRRNLISLVIFTLCALVGGILFYNLRTSEKDNRLPSILRRTLNFNALLSEKVLGVDNVAPAPPFPPKGKKPRVNGRIGLKKEIDIKNWKMQIVSPVLDGGPPRNFAITIDEIKKLPFQEISTEFKCIEGWSEVMSFGGVKFTDFMHAYQLGTKSGQPLDIQNRPQDMFKYIGLETPDGEYFVAMDMQSMLHQNTLLAYQQNGADLSILNGAPLRLYAPNKYGVKSLKRIGKIFFTDDIPRDYWGEQGYDYFIGL